MRTTIICILFISLFACQPEPLVINNVPVAESKMVVSTVVGSEQVLSLFLTKSYGALEGDLDNNLELINNYLVRDAEAWVRSDNESVILEEFVPGIYGTNDINLIPGKDYTLEIYNPSNDQRIMASTKVMEDIRFEEIEIEMETSTFDTLIRVHYKFPDLPGNSYFMINVQKASVEISSAENLISSRVFTHLVNDDSSEDGVNMEGEFIAFFRNVSLKDTMLLSLSNISFEYYDFLERVNNGFLGPSLISEPYNYPSNVSNGYGFFNLYFKDNRFLILEN